MQNVGINNPMYGRKHKESTKMIIAEKTRKRLTGKIGNEAMAYQGNKAKYAAKHIWIRRNANMSDKCSVCSTNTKCHIANLDNKYSREVGSYVELCCLCHTRFDRGYIAIKVNGRIYKKELRSKVLMNHGKLGLCCRVVSNGKIFYASRPCYRGKNYQKNFKNRLDAEKRTRKLVTEYSKKLVPIYKINGLCV